jgi:MFS family permease
MTVEHPAYRIGPIHLAPGILPRHGWSFLGAAFFSIGLVTFIAIGQTYVLTEHLKVPTAQQGSISGDLVFWTELITLALFIPAGILIDRIGRRSIYAIGLVLLGLTYALYPLAESVGDLYLYRILYACGVVTVAGALSTVLVDYPAERSRGKMVAIVGVLGGLGIVVTNQGLGALPQTLTKAGFSGDEAGLYTHLVIAGIALGVALLVALGLKGGTPVHKKDRPGVRALFISGFAQARNPRILLSYASAFIARGDQSVNATFLVLWGSTAGIAAGMGSAEAIKTGTLIFVTAQIAALLWAPVLGPLIDRMDRVSALALCMALAAIGNLALLFLDDPLGGNATYFFILLGIGQISVYLGGQSLIGQEAPKRERGSVIGAFNVSGAIGILLITSSGGRLFDHVDPRAPFIVVGVLNVLLFLASVYVRLKAPSPPIEDDREHEHAAVH